MRSALPLALLLLPACFEAEPQPMTGPEIREAVDMIVLSSKAEAFSSDVVEISTSFTLGDAWEQAVEDLQDFYQSQIPCSTVTVEERTVTIDFGDLSDSCTYKGRTYAGLQHLTLTRLEAGEAELEHAWEGLTDGTTTLDGGATVVWRTRPLSRHVVHDATWMVGEEVLEATGDRTQTLIDPEEGFTAGFRIEGERAWTHEGRNWELLIDGVEVRGQDPIPQAGSYTLVSPAGKQLVAYFERLDEATIRMTLENAGRTKVYEVSRTGAVTEAD